MTIQERQNAIRSTAFAIVMAALAPVAPQANAQGGSDGSLYSRFGIGDLQSFGSPQIVAMGGGGTALFGARYANFTNPAALSEQVLTGVAAGLSYESVDVTDRFENTSRLSNGSLRAVQFSFPLVTNRLGFGASFTPYSTRRYRIQLTDVLDTPSEDVPYTIDFLGTGGVYAATVGLGVRANQTFAIGVEGRLLFGLIEESRETNFDAAGYDSSLLTNSVRVRGFSGRAGAIATFGGIRSEQDALTIGVQFTLPTVLDARQTLTSGLAQERDTLSTGDSGEIELPFSANFGVSYTASPRWLFVADFRYEPWTEFSSTISLPGFDASGQSALHDRTRVSAGLEFVPAGDDQLARYFGRTGYRLGFYFDPLYLSPSATSGVNTIAVTGGLSLPTRFPGTRIDLNIEAGIRGAADANLVRERFIRFGVNLNVGERWFLKTRLG